MYEEEVFVVKVCPIKEFQICTQGNWRKIQYLKEIIPTQSLIIIVNFEI